MNIPKLLEELKSGLDDLRLIDPNHLYAELLKDSIEAIETQRSTIVKLHDEKDSFLREYKRQIEAKNAEIKELNSRYRAEIDRLNGLLAARTREETILHHGRKYSPADLLDIVKAGEDRARELIGLYDCVAAKLAESERKVAELAGADERFRNARDRIAQLEARIGHNDQAFVRVVSERDEAIAKLAETDRRLEVWSRAFESERTARLEAMEEARRLKGQLLRKSEAEAFVDATRPRSFFAMLGLDS